MKGGRERRREIARKESMHWAPSDGNRRLRGGGGGQTSPKGTSETKSGRRSKCRQTDSPCPNRTGMQRRIIYGEIRGPIKRLLADDQVPQ